MKKVIVTGGAGFIGSHLVDKLIEQEIKVIVLDDCSTGKYKNINPKACYINVDITTIDPNQFLNKETDIDVIFHLAAKTTVQESINEPEYYNNVNVKGTLNMLILANKLNVKRFIFSSSSSVYGDAKVPTSENHPLNPLSPYALNKLIGEQYCKLYSDIYNLDTICLRYFNVYGDRMNNEGGYKLVMPIFKEQMLNNKPLTINNDGKQRRDFIHVDDIVNANILCANSTKKLNGDIFNVGTGKSYSVNEVADMFGGEKKYGEKRIEPKNSIAENAKIVLDLNWEPKNKLETWISTYIEQNSTE